MSRKFVLQFIIEKHDLKLKGVKEVRSAGHHRISNHLKEKDADFNEFAMNLSLPVLFYRMASCLTYNDVTK